MSYLGPSVLEGQIRYTSVSQLERYSVGSGGCARKWWYRYVANVKEPEKKAQKLGTQIHSQLEHYLKTGEDVLGDLAKAGRRFIPKPGPDLSVEFEFGSLVELEPSGLRGPIASPLMAADIPVIGKIDLMHARGEWVDDEGAVNPETGAEVIDWKSSKQISDRLEPNTGAVVKKTWTKTPEQLGESLQMLGYGRLALGIYNVDTVRISHGVFQTQGQRAAKKTSIALPASVVRDRWARTDAIAEAMKSTAGEPDVAKVTPNYDCCSAYGGCAYRDRCPRDPKEILTKLLGGKTMSLLDRIKAQATGAPNPSVSAPNPSVEQEKARLLAEERALVTPPDLPPPDRVADVPPCPLCGVNLNAENSSRLLDGTWRHVSCPKMTLSSKPTPASTSCTVSGQVKLDTDAAVSKKYKCSCGQVLKVKPQKLGDGEYYAVVAGHGTEEKPEGKKPEAELPALINTEEQEVSSKLMFYLDAIEDGVLTQRLETYVVELCKALEMQYNAADIRCAPADSPLGFGRYRGALAALARAQPPKTGAYSLSSGAGELTMIVFEALASKAYRIVRGSK